jgi:hypothetical protein
MHSTWQLYLSKKDCKVKKQVMALAKNKEISASKLAIEFIREGINRIETAEGDKDILR